MAKAQKICTRLYEKYPKEVCLHNDLGPGSNNLLYDSSFGCYRAIDPREPVVGPALFDIVFGIGYGDGETDLHITGLISKKLNIPEWDLWRAIYVSICREICQQVKYGGEPNINLILRTEKLMDEKLMISSPKKIFKGVIKYALQKQTIRRDNRPMRRRRARGPCRV
jgi:hypothetical protein